jgi:hypothetical protein
MYCQVKDITRLGDRTCHKCNSEIMENYLRYTQSTALFFQLSLQLLDGRFYEPQVESDSRCKNAGYALHILTYFPFSWSISWPLAVLSFGSH